MICVRGVGSVTWKGCEWVELLVVRTRPTGSGIMPTFDQFSCIFDNLGQA